MTGGCLQRRHDAGMPRTCICSPALFTALLSDIICARLLYPLP